MHLYESVSSLLRTAGTALTCSHWLGLSLVLQSLASAACGWDLVLGHDFDVFAGKHQL